MLTKARVMPKILVVDDETDVVMLFRQQFRKEIRAGEFDFHFAHSGEQALQFMRTLNPFDIVLVLSDINMPGMTGLELIGQLRSAVRRLPVMLLSEAEPWTPAP